jgi:hypothetical protein
MDEPDLAVRTALPEPLRVLVDRYPRTGWEAHPNFTALTRFWLDRHLGFRRMQGLLAAETRAFLSREREPADFGRGLLRVGGRLLDELHGHHTVEDRHYFPLLKQLDPRLGAGFELLEADHDALDAAMAGLAGAANAVLDAVRAGKAAEAAAAALDRNLAGFARLLDRHLIDEEELVVPVILDHPEAGIG